MVGISVVTGTSGCEAPTSPVRKARTSPTDHESGGGKPEVTTFHIGPSGRPSATLQPDPIPERIPFHHDVVLLRQETEDHPLQIRISLKNTSESPRSIAAPGEELPFKPTIAEAVESTDSRPRRLVLDGSTGRTHEDGCWQRQAIAYDDVVDERTFVSGEGTGNTYTIVNSARNRVCWPPGAYSFAQTYVLNFRDDSDPTEYQWGFTLTVD